MYDPIKRFTKYDTPTPFFGSTKMVTHEGDANIAPTLAT